VTLKSGKALSATLGLGGNIGDVAHTMGKALDLLQAVYGLNISQISSLYKTPPWGIKNQDWFVNACFEISTTLSPHQLLEHCLAVELQLKRVRTLRWGPRTIDIDVLTFEGYSSDEPKLTVPHPRMLERAFVLVPLCEIAPKLQVSGKTIENWVKEADRSGIEKIEGGLLWWEPKTIFRSS